MKIFENCSLATARLRREFMESGQPEADEVSTDVGKRLREAEHHKDHRKYLDKLRHLRHTKSGLKPSTKKAFSGCAKLSEEVTKRYDQTILINACSFFNDVICQFQFFYKLCMLKLFKELGHSQKAI